MTAIREEVLSSVWMGLEPFASPADPSRVDIQGWSSDNPYLTAAIDEVRPQIVIEIGAWKGASVITMAERIRELGLNGVVIAIDTWLGSWDHWLQNEWFSHLQFENGYPTLYRTFAANIAHTGLTQHVVPLPLDATSAANVLKSRGIRPEVLHIDGGNDFATVLNDLEHWWPILRPGGTLIGDDYHTSGEAWPGVRDAFHRFFHTDHIENAGGKCIVRKPNLKHGAVRRFV